jgi:hypothetical protein
MNVSHIEFSRPRKLDGSTYTCQLSNNEKKPIKTIFTKAKIIALKGSSQSEYTLFMKCKESVHDMMFDLNAHIVNVVKKNYQSWFVSNMSAEFIEDYYSNTLTYHKDHGQMIKLKCIAGVDLIPKNFIHGKYDIEITFKSLRFYKQKFVLECTIDKCEESDNQYELIDDGDSVEYNSDEEIPEPEPEELRKIKKIYLKKVKGIKDNVEKQINELEVRKDGIYSLMASLELSEHFSEIVKICEQIENICE